jgi:hypothetical protein
MLKVRLGSIFIVIIVISFFVRETSYAQATGTVVTNNGIFVGEPKVYDDRSLQILLNNLKSRLGQLSGLDQNSLISRIGGLQGASATQSGFSMQAIGTPLPGITTSSAQANPTSQTTTGGINATPTTTTTTQVMASPSGTTTTTTTASTTPSNSSNNQVVTTAPGSTSQTQITTPSVTPAPSAQPIVPSYTMPSTFSPSSLDILGEQMQLSYEIINLQMLLEGSLNDQYIKGTHFTKQHVTVGFPISIAVPNKDYRNAVAEVEITICNPPAVIDPSEAPSLMTILPREKTYNVASLVNKSFSLGAGAVISGVVNVGGSFLWGHETYYIVRDQDTVAFQRPPRNVCPPYTIMDEKSGKLEKVPSIPLTFAWQFRPVLGQKIIQDGLRQTFAQISFPNPYSTVENNAEVVISTKWRKYCNHIVGEELSGSSSTESLKLASFFQAPYIESVDTVNNHDGSMTVRVGGKFLSGARVRIGSIFLDDSTPGFMNTLDYIKFTASNQSLATNSVSIVNRDGFEKEIDASNLDAPEAHGPSTSLPRPEETTADSYEVENEPTDSKAVLAPFSDTLIQVTVPLREIPKVPLGGPYPTAVIVGGKAFGLSDMLFKSETNDKIVFLAPKDLLHNQRVLTIKKLFLGKKFEYSVDLPVQGDFAVTGITVLSEGKENTHFAITGTGLEGTRVIQPSTAVIAVRGNGTMGFLNLTAKELDGLKQLVLQNGAEPPILLSLPDTKPSGNKPKLAAHEPISPGTGINYTINGSMLESVTAVRYLDKQLPFALSLEKTAISVTLPDDMTATPGIRSLSITYADGSSDRYSVIVSIPKSK